MGEFLGEVHGLHTVTGALADATRGGQGLRSQTPAAGSRTEVDLSATFESTEAALAYIQTLPSSDLDRELSIAEAAAGVGAVSPFEAAAGFGAIQSLPRADTWVPGMSDPQLWAGARGIRRGQAATELTPAGILQTAGGGGTFG